LKLSDFSLNIPNFLSFARVFLIPLFVYFLAQRTIAGWLGALIVFGVASFTDLLDGWSARRLGLESEFGKFIDPLADKFLVISALIAILALDPYLEVFDLWMILVIAGRDILITVMRYLAIRRGKSLHTSRFGKLKTAFQMVSIGIILMIYIVKSTGFYKTHESIPYWIMVSVTIMTALSGLRYLVTNWRLLLPVPAGEEESSR